MKLIYLFIFFVSYANAAPVPPAPTQQSPSGVPPPGFPIDHHVVTLMAVALIYGLYIIYNKRKQAAI